MPVRTGWNFLNYVLARELGAPTTTRSNGEFSWPCPVCGKGRLHFHTRPRSTAHKDRFACWSCQVWGDERDAVLLVEPGLTREEVTARLREYELAYACWRQSGSDPDRIDCNGEGGVPGGNGHAGPHGFSPRGRGTNTANVVDQHEVERVLGVASGLSKQERCLLASAFRLAVQHHPRDPWKLQGECYLIAQGVRTSDLFDFEEYHDPVRNIIDTTTTTIVCRRKKRRRPPPSLSAADRRRIHLEMSGKQGRG